MDDLAAFRRIHLIGVGGAGMSGLAKLLVQLGRTVSGSDLRPGPALDALEELGIDCWTGHRPEAAGDWDLVVASSAVPASDPELVAAARLGLTVWSRPDLLEALTSRMPAVGVTGTHGKTTGSAMLVTALRSLGYDPSFMVGGTLIDRGTNAHLGDRGLFVLEADEAYGTFERLLLTGLAVTNIEPDHLDHFGTVERLESAFVDVARRVKGPVVACLDDPGSARLAAAVGAITYGTTPSADWVVGEVESGPWEVTFRVRGPGSDIRVAVPRPGLHVARNAAGIIALLAACGYDPAAAAAGLAGFGGLRRRYELKARIDGVTVVDDYAHHPTEVAATLEAARGGCSGRLWAVFQPHRYTRTAAHAAEFGPALAVADRVIVTDVYAAGEAPIPGVSGRNVAEAVVAAGGRCSYLPHRREVAGYLAGRVAAGDLVITLGAGDVTLTGGELVGLMRTPG